MRREYKCEVDVGEPRVNYRECITAKASFDYLHKKQSGGSGQYGRVGTAERTLSESDFTSAPLTRCSLLLTRC